MPVSNTRTIPHGASPPNRRQAAAVGPATEGAAAAGTGSGRTGGVRAAATTLFNSAEGYVTTQGSFHLRGTLMYVFIESGLAAIDAGIRARGGDGLRRGSAEYAWARGVLAMAAHQCAAPIVGVANGGLGVATALIRSSVNALADTCRCVWAHHRDGRPLPAGESFLQLTANTDQRLLTDDIATYVFDAMILGRTFRATGWPDSLPEGMRGASMRGDAGLYPDAASQSSGLAIFASVLSGHLAVWARDGGFDGKEPPALRQIVRGAPDRMISRMGACSSAMQARLAGAIPIPLLIAAAYVAGGFLADRPLLNAALNAGLTTAAFHAFGPAWRDGKFIREVPAQALAAASAATQVTSRRALYDDYLVRQQGLAVSARERRSPVTLHLVADALVGMATSAMMTAYLLKSPESHLRISGGEWEGVHAIPENRNDPDALLGAAAIGLAAGFAMVTLTHVVSGRPEGASLAVNQEMAAVGHGDRIRPESSETSHLKNLASAFLADVVITCLYAEGTIGAPAAVCAGVAAGLVSSIDFHNLGIDSSGLSARGAMREASTRVADALVRFWQGRGQADPTPGSALQGTPGVPAGLPDTRGGNGDDPVTPIDQTGIEIAPVTIHFVDK